MQQTNNFNQRRKGNLGGQNCSNREHEYIRRPNIVKTCFTCRRYTVKSHAWENQQHACYSIYMYTSIYKRSVPTTYWDRIVATKDSKKIVDTCCSICEALRSCQYHARATSKFNTVSFVSPLVHCYKLGANPLP